MANYRSATDPSELPVGWRFKVGIVLFGLGLIPFWLTFPFIFSSFPLATVATLTGAGAVMQKVMLLSAVAVLGKAGFGTLKRTVSAKLAPADEVGRLRYRLGLVMFTLPILHNLLETYASHVTPQLVANRLWVDAIMDLVLVASLFVLGGNFWDKLRALFVREARTVFPEVIQSPAATAPLVVPAPHSGQA